MLGIKYDIFAANIGYPPSQLELDLSMEEYCTKDIDGRMM